MLIVVLCTLIAANIVMHKEHLQTFNAFCFQCAIVQCLQRGKLRHRSCDLVKATEVSARAGIRPLEFLISTLML